ncbi:MAG: hypothetical protein GTO02_04220, partial [Candidatus Dadabacteria bacterium]|nr:hypothetical protein [Candidatus Dadabacteria bacterium]NIQ13627.1 hypothetical protein [Candidatus Dadabacteria bacterium]
FTIEIIDTKSTVAGCILGSDFTIQDKVATASFVVDYVLDVVRNLRVLVKITPINGAPFQTFTDILVSPIGVSISGPDTIVVDIDPEAEG